MSPMRTIAFAAIASAYVARAIGRRAMNCRASPERDGGRRCDRLCMFESTIMPIASSHEGMLRGNAERLRGAPSASRRCVRRRRDPNRLQIAECIVGIVVVHRVPRRRSRRRCRRRGRPIADARRSRCSAGRRFGRLTLLDLRPRPRPRRRRGRPRLRSDGAPSSATIIVRSIAVARTSSPARVRRHPVGLRVRQNRSPAARWFVARIGRLGYVGARCRHRRRASPSAPPVSRRSCATNSWPPASAALRGRRWRCGRSGRRSARLDFLNRIQPRVRPPVPASTSRGSRRLVAMITAARADRADCLERSRRGLAPFFAARDLAALAGALAMLLVAALRAAAVRALVARVFGWFADGRLAERSRRAVFSADFARSLFRRRGRQAVRGGRPNSPAKLFQSHGGSLRQRQSGSFRWLFRRWRPMRLGPTLRATAATASSRCCGFGARSPRRTRAPSRPILTCIPAFPYYSIRSIV